MSDTKYYDADGDALTIHQLVLQEPEWAASRVQVGESALDVLQKIKEWDIEEKMEAGEFRLPLELREAIQKVGA